MSHLYTISLSLSLDFSSISPSSSVGHVILPYKGQNLLVLGRQFFFSKVHHSSFFRYTNQTLRSIFLFSPSSCLSFVHPFVLTPICSFSPYQIIQQQSNSFMTVFMLAEFSYAPLISWNSSIMLKCRYHMTFANLPLAVSTPRWRWKDSTVALFKSSFILWLQTWPRLGPAIILGIRVKPNFFFLPFSFEKRVLSVMMHTCDLLSLRFCICI